MTLVPGMTLVTGAAGKTGQALIVLLAKRGVHVRAFVRTREQAATVHDCGASEVVLGDLRSLDDLKHACTGVATVYHICPNMFADELLVGQHLIDAARSAGVLRIVYHSVLHPQTEEMPHHWNKLRVEELLFKSGLEYTILQPAAYMQNLRGNWQVILEQGVYRVPYALETRLGLVDLNDVAEAAANVLSESGHVGAVYELAGPQVLTQIEVAEILSTALGRPVRAEVQDRAEWAQAARRNGLGDYAVETLLRMFKYYEMYGFWGSARVLEMLIGRRAVGLGEWVVRQASR